MVSEHAVRSSSAAPRCSAAPGGRGHLNFGPVMEWDACAPWMGWEECCAAPPQAAARVGELKFSSSYEMRTRKLPSQLKPHSLGFVLQMSTCCLWSHPQQFLVACGMPACRMGTGRKRRWGLLPCPRPGTSLPPPCLRFAIPLPSPPASARSRGRKRSLLPDG